MSEFTMTMPMQIDDVYDLELSSIGKGKAVKIISSEVKNNNANTGQVWHISAENMKEPGTKLLRLFISLPKQVEIAGANADGYVEPESGKKITKEDCAKRVAAGMRSIAQVVRAFKIPYKNVNGKSEVNFDGAVGKMCNEAEITVKPAAYKDGEAEIPILNPMDRGTESDPNYGREMWPEDRNLVLPPLPKKPKGK